MAIQLQSENARSVAFGSLTGSLANVGSATTNSGRIVYFMNGTNQPVTISWDGGTTSGFILPASSALSVDCSINRDVQQTPELPAGAQFQASHNGTAPTSGSLSIMVIYS
tara:strand:- start:621 stop:950 length:330 start_codon:yes stop_codon:yes gene_type:complete